MYRHIHSHEKNKASLTSHFLFFHYFEDDVIEHTEVLYETLQFLTLQDLSNKLQSYIP